MDLKRVIQELYMRKALVERIIIDLEALQKEAPRKRGRPPYTEAQQLEAEARRKKAREAQKRSASPEKVTDFLE